MLTIYISINVVYCLHTSDRGLSGRNSGACENICFEIKGSHGRWIQFMKSCEPSKYALGYVSIYAGHFKFVYSGLSVSERFA